MLHKNILPIFGGFFNSKLITLLNALCSQKVLIFFKDKRFNHSAAKPRITLPICYFKWPW